MHVLVVYAVGVFAVTLAMVFFGCIGAAFFSALCCGWILGISFARKE